LRVVTSHQEPHQRTDRPVDEKSRRSQETGSDRARRFAHSGMKPRLERPTTLPNLVDIDALAAHLGVSVRHVRRLVAERRIPYLKWGHLLRFHPAQIAAW